jgi:GT2 family glycosyltransferase
MFRGELLKRLGGFDERFFYHFEEVDLCKRVWAAGHSIVYCPHAVITHLGGQSVGRFPIRFALEKYRNRYRYFFKHFGMRGVRRCRIVSLADLYIRHWAYGALGCFRHDQALQNRLEMYRVAIRWNRALDPKRFIEQGVEPDVGFEPLAAAPDMLAPVTAQQHGF